MLNFEFCSPTTFVFGRDVEDQTGEYVKKFGGHKVMLHYGGGSVVRSGLLDRVKASLEKNGIAYCELGGVRPNPRSGLVYQGIDMAREENVDFMIGVGGGSAIDSAKAIAMGVRYDGDFWDFYAGKAKPQDTLPIATVVTIPAAGSEGSDSSVITHEDGMLKRGFGDESIRPIFSVMNPERTFTLPPYQTACGCVDIMAHILERYLSNTQDVELTDYLCEAVLKTVIRDVPIVLRQPEHYGARANIFWAGMVAHNNSCGVGREQDWSSHNIEHELSAAYDVAHGAGLAVVFPAFMKYTLKHDVSRYAQLAVRVWNCEMDHQDPERTAREGIARMEAFFESIGMPTRFEDIEGSNKDDLKMLAAKVGLEGEERMGSFVPLSTEDIEAILKLTYRNP